MLWWLWCKFYDWFRSLSYHSLDTYLSHFNSLGGFRLPRRTNLWAKRWQCSCLWLYWRWKQYFLWVFLCKTVLDIRISNHKWAHQSVSASSFSLATDYCVDPNAVGVGSLTPRSSPSPVPSPSAIPLPVLAFSDSCSPTSPCNKCIGDCDADSDCIGLLVCKERDGGEPVEGCSGSSDSSK